MSPIRVLIASDTALMRVALSRLVASAPSLHVCGAVGSESEALERIPQLHPDVIAVDVEMPANKLEALKRTMQDCPCPVIMVTALTHAEMTVEGLGVCAVEYLAKQRSGIPPDPEDLRRDLVEKIEAAGHGPRARNRDLTAPALPAAKASLAKESHGLAKIVAIGTSTGGPKALLEILPKLPADLPVGIVIVQHMPPGLTAPLAKHLDPMCKVSVCEARDGEIVGPGGVYLAPAGKHLTVWRKPGTPAAIRLSEHPRDAIHKPSVDVMMLSVAEVFGRHAMGAILTGMGKDGLIGMTAIHDAGGFTIGQDEATCAVYGMPRYCAEKGILQRVAPLFQIPRLILHAVRYGASDNSLAAGSGT